MQQFRITALALVSMAALAACSDNPAGVAPESIVVKPTAASAVSNTVCSDATTGGATLFTNTQNVNWASNTAIAGSKWIGPNATADVDFALSGTATFTSTFNVPAGATGVSLSGLVSVDNDVLIKLGSANIFSSFDPSFTITDPRPGYPPAGTASGTNAHFAPGNMVFTASSGFNVGGSNTVTFTAFNDNAIDPAGHNPFGLDFCYTVTYEPFVPPPPPPPPPPPSGPVFVIGDKEAHLLFDNVNFWGAQWWKNNQMTGVVSNGVAAFKGYADVADNFCGGTWTSLPGNSSKPPATLGPNVTIIVTSTVLKAGNNISGNIVEILTVHQDGGYGPNPGHAGNGPVTAITCPVD